ncbi:enoyl-ACP reductase FabV [Vagococcus hydrophili]|uniref:Trans-2-enoyl-CoA reductase [NADH] n=1 Tax=Vagococcus hydrophili TaxID=2714947 RepID=A0A6G8AX60_9ENTE|nr:enoyl-ACP reductase FabV [Vagococcus hydrophili]QIL49644.1 trans-2-enoyl-CoA reductase family protein [Vagococcus hydrophili]
MKVEMKLKGNMARSVNPNGCKQEVLNQINYVKKQGDYEGTKKALVLGASSSYGLASRITAAFGSHADTIGVSFERGPKDETMLGTAGWYNNIFFKEFAEKEGLIAKNFIGDAFSLEMKEQVIDYIKQEFGGEIDLLVYSLAAPKRTDYKTGITYSSALKPIGQEVSGENINLEKEELFIQTVEPATEEEIEGTVKVMGGEDWEWWVELLKEAGCLAEGFKTVLYSYIGPDVTHAFYHDGSLGVAKEQAEESSKRINKNLKSLNGESLICVSKAVTTKASVVIPILPKYLICLYKVMQEMNLHETPIMHKDRIFRTMLYGTESNYDEKGRLRPDSWELRADVQEKVNNLMAQLTADNFKTDLIAYDLFKKEFFNLNGFDVDGNTNNDVDVAELMRMKP